jgi:hypothetical protein
MADPGRGDQASPDEVAAVAIEAIREGQLYAPTFNDTMAASVRARLSALGDALDQLAGDGS